MIILLIVVVIGVAFVITEWFDHLEEMEHIRRGDCEKKR